MKIKAYKLLMILQGLLWFYLTVQSAVSDTVQIPVLILMALDGALYILLAFPDLHKPAFKLAIPAFLATNTVLTVTDQMGFWDYLVLGWNAILLVLVFLIVFWRKKR